MIDQNPRKIAPPQVDEIDDFLTRHTKRRVREEAEKQGLPVDYADRQATAESAYKPDVITGRRLSSAGAIGTMQLMPKTAQGLGVNPYDVDENIVGGVKYSKQMLDRYKGDQQKGAAAYNRGPGNVDKYGLTNEPAETRAYRQKVAGNPQQQPQDDIDEFLKRYQPPAETPQPQQPAQPRPPATKGVFAKNEPLQKDATFAARQALDFRPYGGNTGQVQNQTAAVNRRAPVDPKLRAKADAYQARSPIGQVAEDVYSGLASGGEQMQQAGQRVLGAGAGLARKIVYPTAKLTPVDIRSKAGQQAQEYTAQQLDEQRRASGDPLTREIASALPVAAGGTIAATAGGLPAVAAYNVGLEDWQNPVRSATRAALNTVVPMAGGRLTRSVIAPTVERIASPVGQTLARVGSEAIAGGAANVGQSAAEQAIFDGQVDPAQLRRAAVVGGVLSGGMAASEPNVSPTSRALQRIQNEARTWQPKPVKPVEPMPKGSTEPMTGAVDVTPVAPGDDLKAAFAPFKKPAPDAAMPKREDFKPGVMGDKRYQVAVEKAQKAAAKASAPAKPQFDPAKQRQQVINAQMAAQEAEQAGNFETASRKYKVALDTLGQMRGAAKIQANEKLWSDLNEEMIAARANMNAARKGQPGQSVQQQPADGQRQPVVLPSPVESTPKSVQEGNTPTRSLTAELPATGERAPLPAELPDDGGIPEVAKPTPAAEPPSTRTRVEYRNAEGRQSTEMDNDLAERWNAYEKEYEGRKNRAQQSRNYQERDAALRGIGFERTKARREILELQADRDARQGVDLARKQKVGKFRDEEIQLNDDLAQEWQKADAEHAARLQRIAASGDGKRAIDKARISLGYELSAKRDAILRRQADRDTFAPKESPVAEESPTPTAELPRRTAELPREPQENPQNITKTITEPEPSPIDTASIREVDDFLRRENPDAPRYTEGPPTGRLRQPETFEQPWRQTPEAIQTAQGIAAQRQREALPPIERRRAMREVMPKGSFGKLSEAAYKRGDNDESVVAHPQLRRLLGLPEMPPYHLPDAPINPKTGQPYVNPEWGKAAQDTLNALAGVAGKERSSQINFGAGELSGGQQPSLAGKINPQTGKPYVYDIQPKGKPTRGEYGDLVRSIQELARQKGERIEPSLDEALKGTAKNARASQENYQRFLVGEMKLPDGRIVEDSRRDNIYNALYDAYRKGQEPDSKSLKTSFLAAAADYGISSKQATDLFENTSAFARANAKRHGSRGESSASVDASVGGSGRNVQPVEQRATGTEGGGRAAVSDVKPAPEAKPLWQRTWTEVFNEDFGGKPSDESYQGSLRYRQSVIDAAARGENIPANVLEANKALPGVSKLAGRAKKSSAFDAAMEGTMENAFRGRNNTVQASFSVNDVKEFLRPFGLKGTQIDEILQPHIKPGSFGRKSGVIVRDSYQAIWDAAKALASEKKQRRSSFGPLPNEPKGPLAGSDIGGIAQTLLDKRRVAKEEKLRTRLSEAEVKHADLEAQLQKVYEQQGEAKTEAEERRLDKLAERLENQRAKAKDALTQARYDARDLSPVAKGEAKAKAPSFDDLAQKMIEEQSSAQGGALVSVESLRQRMRDQFPTKEGFDKFILSQAEAGKLALHRHDWPASLSESERAAMVVDEKGNHYIGAALREPYSPRSNPIKDFIKDEGGSASLGLGFEKLYDKLKGKPKDTPKTARTFDVEKFAEGIEKQLQPTTRPDGTVKAPVLPLTKTQQTEMVSALGKLGAAYQKGDRAAMFQAKAQIENLAAAAKRFHRRADPLNRLRPELTEARSKAEAKYADGKMAEDHKDAILAAADALEAVGKLQSPAGVKKARKELLSAQRDIANRGRVARAGYKAKDLAGETVRGVQSQVFGGEWSYVFRQGGLIALNPINIVNGNTFRAFQHAWHAQWRESANPTRAIGKFSKNVMRVKGAEWTRDQMLNDPDYEVAKRANLKMTLNDGAEEVYKDNWVTDLPWMKRTEAANEAALDYLRLHEFKRYKARIDKDTGKTWTQRQNDYERAAETINTLTGKTDLGEGKVKKAVDFLNGWMAAPRLNVSRVKMLDLSRIPREYYKSPDTAKQMAKDAIATVGFWAGAIALGNASGVFSSTLDYDSLDFGKVKFGDTRYDISAGLLPLLRLYLKSGEYGLNATNDLIRQTPATERARKASAGAAQQAAKTYVRGRLGPLAAYANDLWWGENMIGEPVTPRQILSNPLTEKQNPVRRLAVPSTYGEAAEMGYKYGAQRKAEGAAGMLKGGTRGVIGAAPGAVGIGVSDYKAKPRGARR